MSDQAANPDSAEPKVRIWVKLWLAFHMVAITSWSLPYILGPLENEHREPRGSESLLVFNDQYVRPSPVNIYMNCTGLWQGWDMFAPNPANTDFYGSAIVTYQNGLVREFKYPRLYEMGIWDKFLNERYRKFWERVHPDSESYIWKYVANQIARKMNRDPGNPPVRVKLFRHWLTTAEPGKPQTKEYQKYCFADLPIFSEALAGSEPK